MTLPVLVGREEDIESIDSALDAGPGDPYRAVKVHGLRGSGRTVFLNAIEDAARHRGWFVVSETARPGFVERLRAVELPRALERLDRSAVEGTITSASATAGVAGISGEREVRHRYEPRDDLRSLLTRLADVLDQVDAGVLITVDEINTGALDDLRELSQSVQHSFREGRQVAFVCAGLYLGIPSLIDRPGMTFLRRAEEVSLGRVADTEARRGLLDPLQTWGRRILSDALDVAVEGVQGYPYMIQLIGHRMWQRSSEDEPIDREVAQEAADYALRRVGQLVLTPELRPLSPVDRSYLIAMAQDPGPSATSEIANRLGVPSNYGAVCRDRLLKAGLIQRSGRGLVEVTLPTLKDYLLTHAATGVFDSDTDPDAQTQAELDLAL